MILAAGPESKRVWRAMGDHELMIDTNWPGVHAFGQFEPSIIVLPGGTPAPPPTSRRSPAKFTKLIVPTADGFHGSHDMHMIAGTCKDATKATVDGKLEVRGVPCACLACTELRFGDCEMTDLLACTVKHVKAPRAAGETARLRLMDSLEEWAASLKPKQLVAVRVAAKEQSIEGIFWLAVLKGKPFRAEGPALHATDIIEEGYLVVKAQWLKLEKKDLEGGLRAYTALDAEILLVVNHTVRLSGLQFVDGKGGAQGRSVGRWYSGEGCSRQGGGSKDAVHQSGDRAFH